MAPKKTKTWKDNYQDLMDDYGILFEGPKQPSDWPNEHKHLFEVIRDIWATRYATYRRSNKLTNRAVRERRRTAREISKRAHRLRNGRSNEDTWRGLEAEVMRIFERDAICSSELCKNELYEIEHEAEPLAHNEFTKLKRKRERRRPCTCDLEGGSANAELEDSDEAQPVIFTVHKSTAMMHDPVDKLEKTDIPMEPDRTVGLSVSPQMRHLLRTSSSELSRCPMRGVTDVLYPFLLIEAKRGVDSPGFAAIEAQTAFPVRRLLILQDNLQRKAGTSFDPLVWFFAYQGEEWRLYAGTLTEAHVHVYDLWHGTVESLDGSLQLLQIVDYLWTWARDIYRPQIRRSLRALAPTIREISPSTDGSLSRSHSVLSELRLRPLVAPQVDVVMEDDQHTDDFVPRKVLSTTRNSGLHLLQYGPDWPSNQPGALFSPTVLRHSNLIVFSFRAFHCPTREQVLQYPQIESGYKVAVELFDSLLQSRSIVILKHGQMGNLERIWTGKNVTTTSTPVPATVPEERKGAHFYFRTFCRRKDWQIVKELNCVFWDLADVQRHRVAIQREAFSTTYSTVEKPEHYTTLVELLSTVRDISGNASVSYALNNTGLTLSHFPTSDDEATSLRWAKGRPPHVEHFENPASRSFWPPQFYRESVQTIPLKQKSLERGVKDLVSVPEEMGQMGGILAKKPRSWPAPCPRFCLFVLLDIEISERDRLRQLLSDVIHQRAIYGAIDEESGQEELFVDAEDRKLIRKWLGSFGS